MDDETEVWRPFTGLYVLDAQPHAGIALSSANGDSAARHHCLWTGLGVRQIETYAETDPYAETPRGLVLALVESPTGGDLEVRMWNLTSIVNLVKWRVYSAVSRKRVGRHAFGLPCSSRGTRADIGHPLT